MIRLDTSTVKHREIINLHSSDNLEGILYLPCIMNEYVRAVVEWVNGRSPVTNAYRITPMDQISTGGA